MRSLFYGSFEATLYKHTKAKFKAKSAKGVVDEFSYLVLLSGVGEEHIWALEPFVSSVASRCRSGKKALSEDISFYFAQDGVRNQVADYMQSVIIPLVLPERTQMLIADLCKLVENDTTISLSSKIKLYEEANPDSLALLLADMLIYTVLVDPCESVDEYPVQIGNLPLRNEYFTGRSDIFDAINENFHRGFHIQILHGMGGMGKTQVAVQYAYHYAPSFDYIWLVDGTSEETMLNDCTLFLMSRGVDVSTIPRAMVPTAFKGYMNNHKNWLLIFDNCDYYGAESTLPTLKNVIPNNTSVGQVLITSRTLQKLLKSEMIDIGALDKQSAIRFLTERSGCDDEEGASELAQALGCYPLAMEIAASYIENQPGYDFHRYLELLEREGFSLLDEASDMQDYELTVSQIYHLTLQRIEQNGKTGIERFCVRACLLYCSMLNSNHIDLRLFAYMRYTIAFSNAPVENSREHIKEGEESPEENTLLNKVCENELSRNELYRILVKYSLLQPETDGMLYMHPMLQKVVMASAPDDICLVYAAGELTQIHFELWKRAEAYKLHAPQVHITRTSPIDLSTHTQHLYSLLHNVSNIDADDVYTHIHQGSLRTLALLYYGFECYRELNPGSDVTDHTALYDRMEDLCQFIESIDWSEFSYYASFIATVYLEAACLVRIERPDVVARYINLYTYIALEMLKNFSIEPISYDKVSLEMTSLLNVLSLRDVFVYWTLSGDRGFTFPQLDNLLDQIKVILEAKGEREEYIATKFTVSDIEMLERVIDIWQSGDYTKLPSWMRYSKNRNPVFLAYAKLSGMLSFTETEELTLRIDAGMKKLKALKPDYFDKKGNYIGPSTDYQGTWGELGNKW